MHHNPLVILLLQVSLILVVSRIMGWVFARLRQPLVMGEMIAGIMLGPSLFGLLAPQWAGSIFPPDSITHLHLLSQVGVIFFLFLIGLELDPKLIRSQGHAALVISHVSIIAPFLLGAALTVYLYPRVFNDAPRMRFASVAMFMGAAMSITAFPVLARILTERNLHKTKLGAVTITCAAVDDVTAWCLLAFVLGVARADGIEPAMLTAAMSAVYVAVMFLLVKPFLKRLEIAYDRRGGLSPNIVAIIFLLVLMSAYTTERIGIHALFGAFLMGAIMPKGTSFVRTLSEKLEDFTVIFLLPIFFAYTGLQTSIGLLNTPAMWGYTLLIILVACMGKFGGSMLAARSCGIGWRESSAIGILMNTRGLMELVILNIGREIGVITNAVFAMMVIMAIATTALTTPVLAWVYPRRLFSDDAEDVPPPARSIYSILIPVAHPRSGAPLVRIAEMIAGRATATSRIIALFLRRPSEHEAYRSGLHEQADEPAHEQPLQSLVEEAAEREVKVEPLSFVSRDVPAGIAAVADQRQSSLVLMGFHKPIIGRTILGGTVHRVFSSAPCDVAVFVDRGFETVQRVLVPCLGSMHDPLALDLARRIRENTQARITVLYIVTNDRRMMPASESQREVERLFNDPAQTSPVEFRIVNDPSPVDAVLKESANHDLVVIGVAEEWGLESHLFGWRHERIANESPKSLLIVRKQSASPNALPEREAMSQG